MYVDKPMQGHGLMQAIARVNRVFKDKPGGLVVDYLGLAEQLREALAQLHRERRHRARPPSTRTRPSLSCSKSTRSAATCSSASIGAAGPTARLPSAYRCCRPRRSIS